MRIVFKRLLSFLANLIYAFYIFILAFLLWLAFGLILLLGVAFFDWLFDRELNWRVWQIINIEELAKYIQDLTKFMR